MKCALLDAMKNTKIKDMSSCSLGIHFPEEKRKLTFKFYMRNINNICATEYPNENEILFGCKRKD